MSGPFTPDTPSDETLVAYADGLLDNETRASVERYLESDPKARDFVDTLMRSGKLAAQAYDEAMGPPPKALVDSILMHALSRGDAGNVVDIGTFSALRRRAVSYALPLAACLTVVFGAYAAYRASIGTSGGAETFDLTVGRVKAGSLVYQLLETKPSGEPLPVTGAKPGTGPELVVIATFKDRTERTCREFEATHPDEAGSPVTVAVACRTNSNGWIVEGAARLAAAPEAPVKDFSPAGSPESSAIDGILAEIGARPALPSSEEQSLLARKWK